MDNKKELEFYTPRENKSCRFDKRLKLKIVKEVEAGLPRKAANRIYELGKASLNLWMRQYGSPEYHSNKRKQYSNLQKRTIVSAIEQGRMTIKEAQIAYKISRDKVIRDWLLKFKDEKVELCALNPSVMAKKNKRVLPTDVDTLQQALEQAELKIKALNTLIDVAEEQLKISIRKKSGAKQSSK